MGKHFMASLKRWGKLHVGPFIGVTILFLILVVGFQNCGQPLEFIGSSILSEQNDQEVGQTHLVGLIDFDSTKQNEDLVRDSNNNNYVCNPFSPTTTNCSRGVRARLFYLPANLRSQSDQSLIAEFNSVRKMIENGRASSVPIFLDKIDVITRSFEQGFNLLNGDYIKDDNNSRIVEWFALEMLTSIQLSKEDEEGTYQFVIASDDGSLVYIDGNAPQLYINNDGIHPTRVGCAEPGQLLSMVRNRIVPLRIYWYQGPRWHLGIKLFWKKVSANAPEVRDFCGMSGNNGWGFAQDANGSGFRRLISAGFKELSVDNYWQK